MEPSLLTDFLNFWRYREVEQIIQIFGFFFLLEAPRFLLVDVAAVLFVVFRPTHSRSPYAAARAQLFAESPLVSILVPGKDEGKNIYKLVESLSRQTYRNFELIIVDDGSKDNTPLICRSLHKHGLIQHYFRNEERGGKASAANMALRFSKGKFIVHLDADCSFDEDAIEQVLIPFFQYENLGAVGGNVKVRNSSASVCARLQNLEYLNTISIGRISSSLLGVYRLVSGAFGAFPRSVIEQAGGWDIGPGLDGDLTVKVRKMGYRVHFEPRAVCHTAVPVTFKGLWKQRLRWSGSIVRFRMRKHTDVFVPNANFRFRNFAASFENIFFNVVLDFVWLGYFISLFFQNFNVLFYLLPMSFLLYTAAALVQFLLILIISERSRSELKLLPYLPLMMLYMGVYMRACRTVAYVREIFFYASYRDPWNPAKTSVQARAHGL